MGDTTYFGDSIDMASKTAANCGFGAAKITFQFMHIGRTKRRREKLSTGAVSGQNGHVLIDSAFVKQTASCIVSTVSVFGMHWGLASS